MSLHRVSLTRAGLSVGHYSAIEPIQNITQNWGANTVIDFLLCRVNIKHIIEHERDLVSSIGVLYYELFFCSNAVDLLGFGFGLLAVEGAKTAENSDAGRSLLLVVHYYYY